MPALEHILCIVILIGRIGDIGSTYLVTPGLRLEANPLARKLGWPFALLTVVVCLVPYWNTALAVPIAVTSLVVTAENLRFSWIARAIGEDELLAFYVSAAKRSQLWVAISLLFASASFSVLAGLVLFLFYPDPSKDWGFWFATGIVLSGVDTALHRSMFAWRIFRTSVRDGKDMYA